MRWSSAIQTLLALALGVLATATAVSVRYCDNHGCRWSPPLGAGAIIVGATAVAAVASSLARRREGGLVDLFVVTLILAVAWIAAYVLVLAHYGT